PSAAHSGAGEGCAGPFPSAAHSGAASLLRAGRFPSAAHSRAGELARRGFFLSLDGIDGTGKSTQCRLLAEWLREQGRSVVACADPGGTPLGDELRRLVLDHRQEMGPWAEALLFMASRAELVRQVIRPALDAGSVVVCDRFLLANVVYQGHAGGLDPEELWRVGRLVTGGLEPDLTVVLDLPVGAALRRRGRPADRMEARDLAYSERVRQGFLAEAARGGERFEVIDASPPVDEVQRRLREVVGRRLKPGAAEAR
ncbi:MAG TPA: dTMP kinase, partial [Gemmataceae bacterium]